MKMLLGTALKITMLFTVHVAALELAWSGEIPSKPIPIRCQPAAEKEIFSVTGITSDEVRTYSPQICIGVNGAGCSVSYTSATCNRLGMIYKWLEKGVEEKAYSEKEVCNYFWNKYFKKNFPEGSKYSCVYENAQIYTGTWTPECQGASYRGNFIFTVELKEDNLDQKRCEALTNCLMGNEISSKDRKTVAQYLKYLKCE